ncbi:acyltransferase [Flavobacterium sp. 3-210]
MISFLKLLYRLNYNTLFFNFKYFKFNDAIKFPVFVSRNVYLSKTSGEVLVEAPLKTGMIYLGFGDVGIFDKKNSRTIWQVSGKVIFQGIANIGHGAKINVANKGTLILGDNFTISAESSIVVFTKIKFGNNCLLSWDILIMDTDFHKIKDGNNSIINEPKDVIIGENTWIGCRCLILKGAIIPPNSIIGANTTVSKKLESENCLYAGNPINCIKTNVKWEV